MGVFCNVALGIELLVDLRSEAMHQHDSHAHALDHGQILGQELQLARRNGFTGNTDNKGLISKFVDVGSDRAKPGHKGEVENSGHGTQGRERWKAGLG